MLVPVALRTRSDRVAQKGHSLSLLLQISIAVEQPRRTIHHFFSFSNRKLYTLYRRRIQPQFRIQHIRTQRCQRIQARIQFNYRWDWLSGNNIQRREYRSTYCALVHFGDSFNRVGFGAKYIFDTDSCPSDCEDEVNDLFLEIRRSEM